MIRLMTDGPLGTPSTTEQPLRQLQSTTLAATR